jgi:mannitol-specific phosphotransferase system IIBC component
MEVAFLKNRISTFIVVCLIALAALGMVSLLVSNPSGLLLKLAIMIATGAVIFFLVKRFYLPSPEKREQRAFVKAAKRSLKRKQQKESGKQTRKTNVSNITSIRARKKQTNNHLTVIEGKKGKRKNRVSL